MIDPPDKIIIDVGTPQAAANTDVAIVRFQQQRREDIANLRTAIDRIRHEILPPALGNIDEAKLIAAYLLFQKNTTIKVAQMMNIPVAQLQAWMAGDDDFREVLDRFIEVREQEIYRQAVDQLGEILNKKGLKPGEQLQTIKMTLDMRRFSDARVAARKTSDLKQKEIELRMAALQKGHAATFSFLEDAEPAQDAEYKVLSEESEELVEEEDEEVQQSI